MKPLRLLIVDDEPLVRRDLRRMLSAEADVEVVDEASNGVEALQKIEELAPDVVFLDVQMPELDGLGVTAEIDPEEGPLLVFVTAFDRYALNAFDAHAVDYLLKPFDAARCRRALDRVRERLAGSRSRDLEAAVAALLERRDAAPRYLEQIAARGTRRIAVIDVANVFWIEAADNYVRLHTASGPHLSRRTMRELTSLLDPARFARIHRSTIVNLRAVRELQSLGDGDYQVLMQDGTKLTLSRSFRDEFNDKVGGIA